MSENLEKLDSLVESDKCKSPNSKKLKLTKSEPSEPVVVINADENSSSIEAEGKSSSKSKRLGSKEKDILNYINENFNNSPKPVLTVGDVALSAKCLKTLRIRPPPKFIINLGVNFIRFHFKKTLYQKLHMISQYLLSK